MNRKKERRTKAKKTNVEENKRHSEEQLPSRRRLALIFKLHYFSDIAPVDIS